jgi:hypothetical protein
MTEEDYDILAGLARAREAVEGEEKILERWKKSAAQLEGAIGWLTRELDERRNLQRELQREGFHRALAVAAHCNLKVKDIIGRVENKEKS